MGMGAGRGWVAGLALTMLGGSVVGALAAPATASAAVTASVTHVSAATSMSAVDRRRRHAVVGKVGQRPPHCRWPAR